MRRPAFQSLLFALLALFSIASAQTTVSTYYMTRTVYRVSTVTMTGTPPASVMNTTSTVSASYGTIIPLSSTANYTMSGTGAGPTVVGPTTAATPTFTGAASHMNANAFVAALVAGVGYMAL